MAFHLYEDTWETSTTTGTGSYALLGAVTGWRAFSAQYANGDTCWYTAYDGTNFEQGIGTWATGNTLARTTVYRSTNSNSAVNWGAGTKNIIVSPQGLPLENLLVPGSVGFPRRTADNAWSFDGIGQITAFADNTAAGVGKIGQVIESRVASGGAVNLSTGVATDITNIVLTPGDWDVSGFFSTAISGSSAITTLLAWINSASASVPAQGTVLLQGTTFTAGNLAQALPTDTWRVATATTTTLYISGLANWSGGGANVAGYGFIRARRMR